MRLELQNIILEMVAKGESLSATLERLCLEVEKIIPSAVCSVLAVENTHLRALAAPSLADGYSSATVNVLLGALTISCGFAASLQEAVVLTDIEADPRWGFLKELIRPWGVKACWFTPIFSGEKAVATLAFYCRENRGPTDSEQSLVADCVHLCSIAIERHERVLERQRLAYTDALTGLPNRARFNQFLAEVSVEAATRWGILLADVDNLKLVNDTFGHAAGDALIQQVANRISAIMTPEMTFRLGGDEFAVILIGADKIDLGNQASRILTTLRQASDCDGHMIFPTATLGGASSEPGATIAQVRQNADLALYHAKERARGQYIEYYAGLGTALTRRFRAIRDVRIALVENRLDAHYQPVVRLDTREIVGFEALCRMTTVSGEIIAAANFHEATKDAHVAAELTQRMLLRVAGDVRIWLDMGLPIQHVGINLSAADFRNGDLQERLRQVFADAGVPLKHIILEVTESVYMGERDHVIADEIQALRAMGLRIALDDFGTGFASLTHLLTVPVDIIKIDKSFVDRLIPRDGATFIVEGLIGIAKNMGIGVVAEGIETPAQAEQLLSIGCLLGQGYLYSKAVDRDEATKLLRKYSQKVLREGS